MEFTTLRLYGSIAIILGCFIFLYPKLLHPIIMAPFRGNENVNKKDNDFIPPPLRDKHPDLARKSPEVPDHIRKMRNGPHPGMRAAAAEQSKQTKGSGRGMMGVVLPMYAVGIVVYLVYTLFKVFNKKDEKSRDRRSSPKQSPQRHSVLDRSSDSEGKPQAMTQEQLKQQLSELHNLADRVQEKDMNEMDMRKLQERLTQTEAQMTQILAAMQAMQSKVTEVSSQAQEDVSNNQGADTQKDVKGADDKVSDKEGLEKQDQAEGEKNGAQETLATSDNSAESSHESESYEIINKSDRDSGEENVETIASKASELQEEDGDGTDVEEEDKPADVVEEVILKDKTDPDEEENVTVRKRITKFENKDS